MNKLFLSEAVRITKDGEVETLNFDKGLNLLIGQPNTGKTVWLKLIDYCFGDAGNIEKALSDDNELLSKYVSVQLKVTIGETNYIIERDWTKQGLKTKTIVNSEPMDSEEFSEFILKELELPVLKIPKGNPYLNTWNSLSFRTIFRHIYRQERFWSELADKQPPGDQFASISLFLSFAEKLFPQELGEVTKKYKLLSTLESKKEQFTEILDKITRELTSEDESGELSYATLLEIDALADRYAKKEKELLDERQEVIRQSVSNVQSNSNELILAEIARDRQSVVTSLVESQQELSKYIEKYNDISELQVRLIHEINRLKRADASSLISDLKITHCPACDQSVENLESVNDDHCFLCRQPVEFEDTYDERLEIEINQLKIEQREIEQLKNETGRTISTINEKILQLEKSVRRYDQKIAPLKSAVSVLTNERLSIIDVQRGQLAEKIENLKRIRSNVLERNELTKSIDTVSSEIEKTEKDSESLITEIPFADLGQRLEDGMNSYLSHINRIVPGIWTQGRVQCLITSKGVNFYVGNKGWLALSATLKAYFLLAYHYGLLSLSGQKDLDCPNFLIVDFPMQFEKEEISSSTLNYMITPFLELSKRVPIQVIIAGRSFDIQSDEVNSITLDEVYK